MWVRNQTVYLYFVTIRLHNPLAYMLNIQYQTSKEIYGKHEHENLVLSMGFLVRRGWRYQRGNQNSYVEEGQTTQWPK